MFIYNFRSKNTVNILIKNLLDCLLGSVTYWIIGWGVAYGKGGNSFIGGSNYFGYHMEQENYPLWFYKFVFAATAATIVSGAIAERCQFGAYLCYSVTFTGLNFIPMSLYQLILPILFAMWDLKNIANHLAQ